jgi:cell division septation protein DedD
MIALIVGVVGGFAALLLRGSTLSVAPPAAPGPAPSPAASSPPAVNPPPSPPVAVTPPVTPPAAPPVPPVASEPPASPTKPPVVSSSPPAKPTSNTKPVSSTPTASQPASSQPSNPASTTKPTSSAMTKPAPGSGLGGNEPIKPTAMAAKPKVAKPIATPPAPAQVKPKPAPTTSGVSRSQFLKSYRVAVGSFSGSARANSAAAGLRARGLPAVALPSGGVMIVVVGPYASESAARAALNRVQPSYPDAILYRPNGSRSRASTATTATPSVKTPPDQPPATTTSDEGAYLQVAAFRNITAATPLLTKLRGSGYPAFLRSSPDGFTRVLVGPLAQDALRQARSDLQKRGHQPFAVTK